MVSNTTLGAYVSGVSAAVENLFRPESGEEAFVWKRPMVWNNIGLFRKKKQDANGDENS